MSETIQIQIGKHTLALGESKKIGGVEVRFRGSVDGYRVSLDGHGVWVSESGTSPEAATKAALRKFRTFAKALPKNAARKVASERDYLARLLRRHEREIARYQHCIDEAVRDEPKALARSAKALAAFGGK